jgi:CII-binding regulator of phage lambda lysogenization HflD
MSNTIQFLLHQLATNEQDRERFNLFSKTLKIHPIEEWATFGFKFITLSGGLSNIAYSYESANEMMKEKIIRTCLSRVNYTNRVPSNPSVLTCLGALVQTGVNTSDILYLLFDRPLRHGKSLDEAIESLHDKMLELVPEYQEFNNKN